MLSVHIRSSDTDTQPAAINEEALHVGEIARASQGVVEREQWESGSTEFGADYVLGVRDASGN